MNRVAATLGLSALMCLAAAHAAGQTVYRCGSAYSDAPCPQATVVDAADARTPAQRADAKQVAADEKRLGAQMEQDRLAAEKAQKPLRAASLSGPAAKPAERGHGKKIKWPKLKKAKAEKKAQG